MSANLHIKSGNIKRTLKTRVDFIQVLATQLPQSSLYKKNAEVKAEADALVILGQDLEDSDISVGAAEAILEDARTDLTRRRSACDRGLDTFFAKVEQHVTEEKELTELALEKGERADYKVDTPTAVLGQYNLGKLRIELEVTMPPGIASCLIEESRDPSDPTSWKRVKGLSKRRNLSGYPPGTYAVRAMSVRGNEESNPTPPITVVVK